MLKRYDNGKNNELVDYVPLTSFVENKFDSKYDKI